MISFFIFKISNSLSTTLLNSEACLSFVAVELWDVLVVELFCLNRSEGREEDVFRWTSHCFNLD